MSQCSHFVTFCKHFYAEIIKAANVLLALERVYLKSYVKFEISSSQLYLQNIWLQLHLHSMCFWSSCRDRQSQFSLHKKVFNAGWSNSRDLSCESVGWNHFIPRRINGKHCWKSYLWILNKKSDQAAHNPLPPYINMDINLA